MKPFDAGRRDGQWTDEQIAECGFSSAQECLEFQEEQYQEEIDALSRVYRQNPQFAREQSEYLEGLITAKRESLRGR